jgi:hypothetical protein
MRSRDVSTRQRGIVLAEVVTGLLLFGLILALTGETVRRYQEARDEGIWRRTAAWAADGQLQRLQAGAALDSLPPAGLFPEAIQLAIRVEPGEGEWAGFRRATVTASVVRPNRRTIHQSVAGYIPGEGGR